MSVFLDVGTGKMFDTLAELKAFQRSKGEATASPSFLPKEQTNSVEEVETVEQKPEIEEEDSEVEFEGIREGYMKKSSRAEITVKKSRAEMVEELKGKGVDGRTLGGRASDEHIAEMYMRIVLGRG